MQIKRMIVLIMAIFMIMTMPLVMPSQEGKATITGTLPPDTNGDWVITEDTKVENEEVTISDGKIDIRTSNGVHKFIILNSTIRFVYTSTSYATYGFYAFSDVSGQELTIIIYNSTITVEGVSIYTTHDFIAQTNAKLHIRIENSTFDNFKDIYYGSPTTLYIRNSTFLTCRYGLRVEQPYLNDYLQDVYIDNNTIEGGIRIWSGRYYDVPEFPTINITNSDIKGVLYVMGTIANFINCSINTAQIYIRTYTEGYIYIMNTLQFKINPPNTNKTIEVKAINDGYYHKITTNKSIVNITTMFYSAEYGKYTKYYYNISLNGYLMEMNYPMDYTKPIMTFEYNVSNIAVNPKIYPLNTPYSVRMIAPTTLLVPVYNVGNAYVITEVWVKRNGTLIYDNNITIAPFSCYNITIDLSEWWHEYRHYIEVSIDPYNKVNESSEADNNLAPTTFYTTNLSGSHVFGVRIDDMGVSVAVTSDTFYSSEISVNSYKYLYDVLKENDAYADAYIVFAYKDPDTLEVKPMTQLLKKDIIYWWRNHTDRIIPQTHGWTHTLPSKYGDTGTNWMREFANVVLHQPINYSVALQRLQNISEEYHKAFPDIKYNLTNMLFSGLYASYPDTFYALKDMGYKYIYAYYYNYDGTYKNTYSNRPYFGHFWTWSSYGMMDIYSYPNPNPDNRTIFNDYIDINLPDYIKMINLGVSPAIYCHAGAFYVDINGKWLEGYNGSMLLDVAIKKIRQVYPDAQFISPSKQAQLNALGYTYTRVTKEPSINGEYIKVISNINKHNISIPLPDWWSNHSCIFAYDFTNHKFFKPHLYKRSVILNLTQHQVIHLYYSETWQPHLNITLSRGWNAIALPRNMTIKELLEWQNTTSLVIRQYNETSHNYIYITIIKGFNDDNPTLLNMVITRGTGLYIYANKTINRTISIFGIPLYGTFKYTLKRGWNFIGLPPLFKIKLKDLLSILPSKVSSVVIRDQNGQYITLIRNFEFTNLPVNPETYILSYEMAIYVYINDTLTLSINQSINLITNQFTAIQSISKHYQLHRQYYQQKHRELIYHHEE